MAGASRPSRSNEPFRRSRGSPHASGEPGTTSLQPGTWRMVEDARARDELLDELAAVGEYALDTEFHRERTYFPHLALVQIAWSGGIALIDPLAVDPAPLASVFSGDGLAVLHAADQDLEVLERACGALPRRIFDTQISAGFLGYASPSLVSLTEALLGIRLHKGDQLADWIQRPLAASQLSYAAGDVAHLLEMRRVLAGRLAALGRTRWAEEECAVALAKDRSPTVPEEAWWRLPHSRQLRGASRGIAQEVAAWRERRAQRLDVPVRFVLADLGITCMAQRPPRDREELRRTRGVDARHLTGSMPDEVLAAVAAGRALAPEALRMPSGQSIERLSKPMIALASAYVGQRAADLELDPAVLATRADLVGFFQDTPSGRLTSGWRHELIGASLERLVTGRAALAFDGHGELVLEERSGTRITEGELTAEAKTAAEGGDEISA
ncbi:MAG TPA: HRDC domain-containing protein [Acidimicrobiales bacterium]|nr:HRDC domain-containing protein [Acidimicrobiales bacterium]